MFIVVTVIDGKNRYPATVGINHIMLVQPTFRDDEDAPKSTLLIPGRSLDVAETRAEIDVLIEKALNC